MTNSFVPTTLNSGLNYWFFSQNFVDLLEQICGVIFNDEHIVVGFVLHAAKQMEASMRKRYSLNTALSKVANPGTLNSGYQDWEKKQFTQMHKTI